MPGGCEATAAQAERLGFDGLLLADSQNLVGDVFVELGVLARATYRLGLGTGVVNPLTRHPAVTAAAIASLQLESRGRAVLGVGRGDSSLAQLGLPRPSTARLREFVSQVRGFLRGETVTVDGRASRIGWIAGAARRSSLTFRHERGSRPGSAPGRRRGDRAGGAPQRALRSRGASPAARRRNQARVRRVPMPARLSGRGVAERRDGSGSQLAGSTIRVIASVTVSGVGVSVSVTVTSMVYGESASSPASGVPLITPVVPSMARPAGSPVAVQA